MYCNEQTVIGEWPLLLRKIHCVFCQDFSYPPKPPHPAAQQERTLCFSLAHFGDEVGVEQSLEIAEYKLLCRAVQDACRELRYGLPQSGRDCLLQGLARSSEYAEAGVPWGDALADEYRRALREYDQLVESYLVPSWFRSVQTPASSHAR